jgi:hypothetical protein
VNIREIGSYDPLEKKFRKMPEMHLTTETFRLAGIGVDHGYAHSLNVSAESNSYTTGGHRLFKILVRQVKTFLNKNV